MRTTLGLLGLLLGALLGYHQAQQPGYYPAPSQPPPVIAVQPPGQSEPTQVEPRQEPSFQAAAAPPPLPAVKPQRSPIQSNGNTNAEAGLTPQTVASWCSGGDCNPNRFEQLPETNGAINPHGVHMKDGPPVTITIPSGNYHAQVWTCFETIPDAGPGTYQTCQMSVRKFDY
ncbi:hypothetical protein [Nitrolancea hollandica]|uniref:Uncharacterized protein n=1 Tax=Nitrolancea hollandica Lb TaxID=1129897 RepID=I4ELB1_9BACT|nr:hypothetical protein [Nitrolancea hollandica]CCF85473.1 exported hypothetical protein [Nitrolancea hollandica Lb]